MAIADSCDIFALIAGWLREALFLQFCRGELLFTIFAWVELALVGFHTQRPAIS